MAEVTLGIDNLKKGIKFSIDLVKQVEESGKDGFTWTDGFAFVDELSQAAVVVKTSKQILAELKDLDEAERAELYAYVQVEFDIANDKVEAIVEDSLNIAFSFISLLGKFKK